MSSPSEPRRIVVATGNRGKLAEIRSAIDLPGWEFVPAAELDDRWEVAETGETFFDNALLKAQAAHDRFGMAALADDSGLAVDALGGAPGVHSSRYAGEEATDQDNMSKLLGALDGVPESERVARFVCVIVLVNDEMGVVRAQGTCEGRIGLVPRGSGGFGYDPLFLPAETPGRTMAELGMAEKNAISHRGAALRALKRELEGAGPLEIC